MKLQIIHNDCREEASCACCGGSFFEEKPPLWRRRTIITGVAAGVLLVSGLLVNLLTHVHWIAQTLFISVIAVAGKDILFKAGRALLKGRLDMNFLMSIAAFGAFFIGHGEEGAAVFFLFFVAESLEGYAADKAKQSVTRLLTLAPETARVKRDGREMELHTHDINPGDVLVVRPGEKVPLDGIVLTGHSSVNEAPITGESTPAEKSMGNEIYAGTMNGEGYIEAEVSRRVEDTVLSRIVRLVEEAEKKKSDTEKFIDTFARYYTPSVIGLSLASFLIPTFLLGLAWDVWFYRALVVLVVSCPCALAISTPVAMVSAITSAARHGVLIKGATYIEELNRVRAVAFDKTGTLTRGRLEVTDIVTLNNVSSSELLSIAASLESRSEHPIAKAITGKAASEHIHLMNISSFRSLRGRGVQADISGVTYFAGAGNLLNDLSMDVPAELSGFEKEGKTAVCITDKDRALGIIALGDRVRNKAQAIISDLKKLRIRTEMLTGDNKKAAQSLAAQTAIDHYYAELLPGDKVKIIEGLASRYGSVAMVGDGINDAPALAAANIGIAMGAAGSDISIETADIALMHDDLSKIEYLIHLSRKTMHVVKQNITVSIFIKGCLTVLALTGLINLWVAVAFGDMGLSLTVILNAMRLTRIKE